MLDALKIILRAHTVERVRNVWRVLTFPLITSRGDSIKLWRACARIAWKGLLARDPAALLPFVHERMRVEASEAFCKGAGNIVPEDEMAAMRSEHVEATTPAGLRSMLRHPDLEPPAIRRKPWLACNECGWMSTEPRAKCPRCLGDNIGTVGALS